MRAMGYILALIACTLSLISCENSTKDRANNKAEDHQKQENNYSLDAFYSANSVLDVAIQMSDEAWMSMSREGASPINFDAGCVFEGFNHYSAKVSLDGETFDSVDIRKKGFTGSLSTIRPSLKFDFDDGAGNEDRTFHGYEHVTLNNNLQDSSTIKTCLSYWVFNRAGINAPACGFAKVKAQGTDLGIFSNVEPIKKAFLKRSFGDASGNLYEISRSGDFDENRLAYFEKKNNTDENDYSDLQNVLGALQLPDEELLSELSQYLNLDYFIKFSALEALVGHTDGYNGFQNNTYFYHNPNDNLLYMIPWGTDFTFSRQLPTGGEVPSSVLIGSELMTRLWQLPEFRQTYDITMTQLLTDIWDESVIKAKADEMATLVDADQEQIQLIKDFIDNQRTLIQAELAGQSNRAWQYELMVDIQGCAATIPIHGTFDLFVSDDLDGEGEFSVTVGTAEASIEYTQGSQGLSGAGTFASKDKMAVVLVSEDNGGGDLVLLVDPALWHKGEVVFHMYETMGLAGDQFIIDGSIVFDDAGTEKGDRVRGSFSGDWMQ